MANGEDVGGFCDNEAERKNREDTTTERIEPKQRTKSIALGGAITKEKARATKLERKEEI